MLSSTKHQSGFISIPADDRLRLVERVLKVDDAWNADQELISLAKQVVLPNERHRFAP
jgi:hypothetical protein